jgi:ornithine cyclodeaminase/alanine dehydrogenase-like protein (mu-crystallin family)
MVGGNLLTALRTAAASAISINRICPPTPKCLAWSAPGISPHSSCAPQRASATSTRWSVEPASRHAVRLGRHVAAELGLPFEAVEPRRTWCQADVIITITSSFAPILAFDRHVPGTHLACMGTDTKGKQEVEACVARSGQRLYR